MLYNYDMENILVNLISTKKITDSKIIEIKNLFVKSGYNFIFNSRCGIDKNFIINSSFKDVNCKIIIIDMDKNVEEIKEFSKGVLKNLEDFDLIYARKKRNKFLKFLNKAKYITYNLFLKVFTKDKIQDNISGFYYLNEKVVKLMNSVKKSPCEILNFKNFDGFEINFIEIEHKKEIKHLIFSKLIALFTFILSIILIISLTLIANKMNIGEYFNRIIIIDVLTFILGFFVSISVLAYGEYKSLI